MSELQAFLSDLLDRVDPFKDVITHIMMREKDGRVLAAAKSRDGSISVKCTSRGEVPGFSEKACLGSLPFLRSALSASYMKDGTIKPAYGPASDGSTQVLTSFTLSGSNRYSVFYQATDPFVNKLNKVKEPKNIDWPVAFAVDQGFISNFDETFRVQQQAPKGGTDRDDIFTLAYTTEGIIEAIFGEKTHSITVQLSDQVEANGDAVNAMFSMSRLRSILRLVGKDTAVGYLSDKALRIDTDTALAKYEFVTSSRKVR